MRRVLTWAIGVATAVFGLGVTALELDYPHDFWLKWKDQVTPVLFAFGVPATLGALVVTWRYDDLRKRLDTVDRVRDLIRGVYGTVLRRRKPRRLQADAVWVTVWLVSRRRYRWRFRRELVADKSFSTRPDPDASIRWTLGKGVIGRCWETGRDWVVNLSALCQAVSDEGSFELLSDEDRLGLTWKEYQEMEVRWSSFATPLRDEQHHIIGVLEVSSSDQHSYGVLDAWSRDPLVGEFAGAIERAYWHR